MAILKISTLDNLQTLNSNDLMLVVESSSLTTYHIPFQSFNTWMSVYGTASNTPTSNTSSHVVDSIISLKTDSASLSISGSYAITTSLALNSILNGNFISYSLSSSWASSSISSSYSLSSSYSNNIPDVLTFASYSLSSSWSSASIESLYNITASYFAQHVIYADTASYFNTNLPGLIKAWGHFGRSSSGNITMSYGYNIISMSIYKPKFVGGVYGGYNVNNPSLATVRYDTVGSSYTGTNFIVDQTEGETLLYNLYFQNPLPDINYNVIGFTYGFSTPYYREDTATILNYTYSVIGNMRIGFTDGDINPSLEPLKYYSKTTSSCVISITYREVPNLISISSGSFIVI